MNLSETPLRILIEIGIDPTLTKEELAEEVDIQKSSLYTYTYKLQQFELILRASDVPYYDEKGYKFMMTAQGEKRAKKELREIEEKYCFEDTKLPSFEVYQIEPNR